MYAHHFGLTSEPFSLTPDPAFLYLSPSHAEALAALKVGLQDRRGLMVMTGEVGTGKTTLLYSLLDELGPRIRSAYIANTSLSFDDMLRLALADFEIPVPAENRLALLRELNTFLGRCAADGVTAALFVDEAQNLQDDTFENLRLLSNFETFSAKLLQIVLVGQPELEAKLRRPSLRQLAERVAVHCHVNPLTRSESRAYIAYRLGRVGGTPKVFTRLALALVVRKAQGIPRRINILCHSALCFAYGREAGRVGREQVRAAVREREGRGLVTLRRAAPWSRRRWVRPAAGIFGLASLAAATAAVLTPRAQQPPRIAALSASEATEQLPAGEAPSVMPAEKSGSPLPHYWWERMKVRVPLSLTRAYNVTGIASPSTGLGTGLQGNEPSPEPSPARHAGEEQERPSAPQNAVAPRGSTLPQAGIQGDGEGSIPAFAEMTDTAGPAVPAAAPTGDDATGFGRSLTLQAVAPAIGDAERPAEPALPPLPAAPGEEKPGSRAVVVQPGTNLEKLLREMYGTVDPQLLRLVRSANPQIVDPDRILAGDTLVFPDATLAQHDPSPPQP